MALFVCALNSFIDWLTVHDLLFLILPSSRLPEFIFPLPTPVSYLWPALCNSRSKLACIKGRCTEAYCVTANCRSSCSCDNIPCVKVNESGAIFEWNFKGGKHVPLGLYPTEGSFGLRWELNVCLDGVDRAIKLQRYDAAEWRCFLISALKVCSV